MTSLGKPLVFYLKYMAEMNRLYGDPTYYGGEEPNWTELCDAEQVQEKARTVGDTLLAWESAHEAAEQVREKARTIGAAAYNQVADFLELCGREMENHFTDLGIATLANKRKRAYVVRNWNWGARVHVSLVPDCWFSCGVWVTAPPEIRISLEKDVCGIALPWLWSKGGRKGADAIWKVVGSWAHSRGGEGLDDDKGTVILACVPIKAQPPESFDVDRDQLIAEVMKVIARIGAKETKAIANFVAGLKESDES